MCGAQYGSAIVCKCKPVPGVHYRMSMKDVPFVVGTVSEYLSLACGIVSWSVPWFPGAICTLNILYIKQKTQVQGVEQGLWAMV